MIFPDDCCFIIRAYLIYYPSYQSLKESTPHTCHFAKQTRLQLLDPPQVLRARPLRRDNLLADGLGLPGLLRGPRRLLRLARRLHRQNGALGPRGRGALVLHALRDSPDQSVHPTAARRQTVDRQREAQPRARAPTGRPAVQGATAAAEVQQPGQRDQQRRPAAIAAHGLSRLQAPAQAVRPRGEEPLSSWTVRTMCIHPLCLGAVVSMGFFLFAVMRQRVSCGFLCSFGCYFLVPNDETKARHVILITGSLNEDLNLLLVF